MDASSAAQGLIRVLERTAERQRRMLTLLERQREAMIARDLISLSELSGELVGLAEEAQRIETERAALTRQLVSASAGDPANTSLRDIADSLDDPEAAARLLELRDELLTLQGQVSAARDRNQALASDILAANDATLKVLMDALRQAGHGPDDTPRVFDRRA